jgi:RNA polymerase sigma-70 factor (ECF subfamily)
MSTWYRGDQSIAAFLSEYALAERWRHLPTSVSGQIAVGCYRFDTDSGDYRAHALDVLTLRGARIAAVTAFLPPATLPRAARARGISAPLFSRLGLPQRLAP